jgi:chaperone modulatory protein CbpM
MAEHSPVSVVQGVIVEEEIRFTLHDLSRACRVDVAQVVTLVEEGVLEPAGSGPDDWRFAGPSLRRARAALRLNRDLELGVAGTALVLDLLDEIESLRARLRRAGLR